MKPILNAMDKALYTSDAAAWTTQYGVKSSWHVDSPPYDPSLSVEEWTNSAIHHAHVYSAEDLLQYRADYPQRSSFSKMVRD